MTARRFSLIPDNDPYVDIRRAYETHRVQHGPSCYAHAVSHEKALLLSALAAGAGRVLEVGTALGYSTLWLAHGVGENGIVDTVEYDRSHAELARQHFSQHAGGSRVRLHEGDARQLVPTLAPGYGLIFLDVDWAVHSDLWPQLMRLLSSGGRVALSNIWVADPADPRSQSAEGEIARDLIQRLQEDPTLCYSLATAGTPMLVVAKRG